MKKKKEFSEREQLFCSRVWESLLAAKVLVEGEGAGKFSEQIFEPLHQR